MNENQYCILFQARRSVAVMPHSDAASRVCSLYRLKSRMFSGCRIGVRHDNYRPPGLWHGVCGMTATGRLACGVLSTQRQPMTARLGAWCVRNDGYRLNMIIREFGIRKFCTNPTPSSLWVISHSAEKRNPVNAISIIYIQDVSWIPLFSGMTVTDRLAWGMVCAA